LSGLALPKAARVGYSGPIAADAGSIPIKDASKFHVQVVFCMAQTFNLKAPPQYLAQSERFPFTLYLQGQANSDVKMVAAIKSSTVGERSVEINPAINVKAGIWNVVDLVYLDDTLSLVLNGTHIGCHGFGSNGTITPNNKDKFFYFGGQELFTRFNGKIAAATVSCDVPPALKLQCDKYRTTAEWYITSAVENRRYTNDPGQPSGLPTYSALSSSWVQTYSNGAMMYNPAGVSAFHIYGCIWDRYKNLAASVQSSLGFLASDEVPSKKDGGRKSLFQGGGIYWSPQTPAVEILGPIYTQYEAAGED
jgi:hypothetical protein